MAFRIIRRVFIIAIFSAMFIQSASRSLVFAQEDAKITILVVNPSDKENLKSLVEYSLPPEIKPEDIIEDADMKAEFDPDTKSYRLVKEVELAPKETRRIGVRVKNVWRITEEDLTESRTRLSATLKALEGTAYESTRDLLNQRVTEKVDAIEASQKKSLRIS